MTNIFIFNNASLAAGYGIGTYVRQLSDGLSAIPDTKVSLVEMYADTREFAISDDDNGTRHYLIPPLQSNMESETYCRIIFYFLARNIDLAENDKLVFQFNYFQHYPLAVLLKAWYINCSIVLTVHYMSWCFELKGNVGKMRKIKRFALKTNQILSSEEMSKLCGMENIPFGCSYEYQKCAIYAQDSVNTGTCKWTNSSSTERHLTCIVD